MILVNINRKILVWLVYLKYGKKKNISFNDKTSESSIYSIGALKARMQGSTRVLKKPQNIYIYEDHMNEKKGFFFFYSEQNNIV